LSVDVVEHAVAQIPLGPIDRTRKILSVNGVLGFDNLLGCPPYVLAARVGNVDSTNIGSVDLRSNRHLTIHENLCLVSKMISNCNRFTLLDDEGEDDIMDVTETISEMAVVTAAKKKNKKKKTKQKQNRSYPKAKTAKKTGFNVISFILTVWTMLVYILTFQWLRRTSHASCSVTATFLISRKETSESTLFRLKKDRYCISVLNADLPGTPISEATTHVQ
jgi:hypothetical protein